MTLTIVTLNFNQGRFLKQNVDSVAAQGDLDIRHVVVDPGSSDNSAVLYTKPWARHLHIVRKADNGPSEGLNNGFAEVTSEYAAFLNADDYLLPGALQESLRRLDRGADVVFGAVWAIGEHDHRRRLLVPDRPRLTYLLADINYLTQPGSVFRMESFRRAGGFNPSNHVNWDHELYVRMIATGSRVERRYDPVACFRIHPGSLSSSAGRRPAECAQNGTLRLALDVDRPRVPALDPMRRLLSRFSDVAKIRAILSSL